MPVLYVCVCVSPNVKGRRVRFFRPFSLGVCAKLLAVSTAAFVIEFRDALPTLRAKYSRWGNVVTKIKLAANQKEEEEERWWMIQRMSQSLSKIHLFSVCWLNSQFCDRCVWKMVLHLRQQQSFYIKTVGISFYFCYLNSFFLGGGKPKSSYRSASAPEMDARVRHSHSSTLASHGSET